MYAYLNVFVLIICKDKWLLKVESIKLTIHVTPALISKSFLKAFWLQSQVVFVSLKYFLNNCKQLLGVSHYIAETCPISDDLYAELFCNDHFLQTCCVKHDWFIEKPFELHIYHTISKFP